jgi:hypothetical protein
MSTKPRYRILTRPVESWDMKPILERMEKGTVLKLHAVTEQFQVNNIRRVVYENNAAHHRALYWKTHWRPEGFFIERWR